MTRNAVAYNGGYWDLSNGSFYLQPTQGYMLTSPNGVMDDTSAQEAGIIVTYEKGITKIVSVYLLIFINSEILFSHSPLKHKPKY